MVLRPHLVVVALSLAGACAERLPDRLALDPAGPFRFERKGQTEELKVAAFTGNRPYVKAVPALWSSSDPSVVSVDDTGKLSAAGSGRATITTTAWGLSTTADVVVSIVGSVEVKADVPTPLSLSAKPWPLKVTVKDDKGNVIEKPLVRFRTSDYCVEVSDEGMLSPMAEGECEVIVESAQQRARLKVHVGS